MCFVSDTNMERIDGSDHVWFLPMELVMLSENGQASLTITYKIKKEGGGTEEMPSRRMFFGINDKGEMAKGDYILDHNKGWIASICQK